MDKVLKEMAFLKILIRREAVRLAQLAAEQGHAGGQKLLGISTEKGVGGLGKDQREATRLYRLAAEQGQSDAQ